MAEQDGCAVESLLDAASGEAVPERIGKFRTIEVIGRGSTAIVVRAERDDGLFSQTVAIKLLRSELGREAPAEDRHLLSRLDHPAIARVVDGGEQDGRPYLVMELVRGRPLLQDLDERRATLAERLEAFLTVAEGVSHAHRRLVVHGDIRASKVWRCVTGQVKLLGFHRGDSTQEHDGPRNAQTGAAYEPLRGEGASVADDVFALGLLLHEMLTGVPGEPGAPQMSRLAPPNGPVSAGDLSGDLDAIVAAATAPDPDERYPDVAALAEDLQRYRARRPVLARHGGRRYRAGMFISRHRRGLALAALVFLGLIAATVISTAMYLEAERARAEAERRFAEVRGVARFMLFDLFDELRNSPGTVRQRVAIADISGRYLDRLRQVPDAPADLRIDSAASYRRLATVQGLSGTASLGRSSAANRSLGAAEALLRSVLAEQPRHAAALEELGWVLVSRWAISSETADAAGLTGAARRHFLAALAADPRRQGARLGLLTTERGRAWDLIYGADRPGEAIPIARQALAQLRAVRWDPAHAEEARLLEVNLLNRLGDATYYAGDYAAALPFYLEADRIVSRRLSSAETAQWLDRKGETMWNISGTLGDIGRPRDALTAARTGIAAVERLLRFGPDANAEGRLLILLSQEANLLSQLGRHSEAAAASSRSVAMREQRLRLEPRDAARLRDLAVMLPPHGDRLARIDDRQGACRAVRRALDLWQMMRRNGALGTFDATRQLPLVQGGIRRHCPTS